MLYELQRKFSDALETDDMLAISLVVEIIRSAGHLNAHSMDGMTFLSMCVDRRQHLPFVMLLEAGADPNIRSIEGNNVLHLATHRNTLDIAESVIEHGMVSLDQRNLWGMTPLINNCRYNQTEMCDLLLRAGADPNIADNSGTTPLMFAALNGGIDIVRALIGKGADTHLKDTEGKTALDHCVEPAICIELQKYL